MRPRRWLAPAFGLASLSLLSFAPALRAQTGQITGTVTDSASGRPLEGVQVVVFGTGVGAVTGPDGRYGLVVRTGTHVLEARRIGYTSARRRVAVVTDAVATLDIGLASTPFRLQEVVVTGMQDATVGTLVPFTVGRLKAEDAPVPSANALELIQGKIAGVTVVPTGRPGAGTNIQLRSPTSINRSNSPLIVVDGVILADSVGSSADLNSLDIERVEVVKGAAGASLYGSRAQAGVLQIWTRRGRDLEEGRTQFTVRSEFGLNSLARKLDWARYHPYRIDAAQTAYADTLGNPVLRDGRVPESVAGAGHRYQDNKFPDPFYDQVDAFFDPGNYYTNQLTIAQNTGRTNWYASASHHRSDGIIEGHGWYRRYDVRLNLDHRLRDDLTFSASAYYASAFRDEIDVEDTFFDLIQIAPDVNLRQPDPDGTPFAFQPDPVGIRSNPLYRLVTEQNWSTRGRFLGSVDLRYTPNAWLGVEANVSFDRADEFRSYFLDRGLKEDDSPTGGIGLIERETDVASALNASLSVTLTRQVGAVTSVTTFRGLMERQDSWEALAQGEDLIVTGVPDLNNARVRDVASSNDEIRANGFFGITSLTYAGKYIVDGLVRRDGSSLFGPAERWHTYGRMSAAYRMAEEPWWPFEEISEFKLRFSRGIAGNRPAFTDQFETYDIDASGDLTKETLGNVKLKPERSTETEYGLDLIALNRFSLQLTYARRTVRDQLVAVPLEALYGFETQWQNAGTVVGNTIEGTLDAQLVSTPALSWRLGVIFDRSRDKITEFNRPCFVQNLGFRCAGEPLGVFYGHRFIQNPNELPAGVPRDQFQVNDDGLLVWVGPGDTYQDQRWGDTATLGATRYDWGMPIRQRDANGNLSVVRIGNSTPDYRVGFSSELRWRDFSFYGLVDVQVGGQVYHSTKQRMYQWWRSGDEDQAASPTA